MAITISGAKVKSKTTVENTLDLNHWRNITDDQFSGGLLDTTAWSVYDNSTFGSPTRIQTYQAVNAVVGTGSSGATNNTSLKLKTLETDAGSGTLPTSSNAGTRYSYTAGMVDSKTAGKYYPRYSRFEWRAKIPHGQGLWPSFWLTAKTGGATTCEMDIVEYFHSQIPGKNSTTIHRTNAAGTFVANAYTNNANRTFFEAPTLTPAWHVWTAEIVPVTDSGGLTTGDYTQPSANVRLTVYLDGAQVYQVVDTSALWWTTNGGTEDSFWNIYLQGCQVDGNFVGHPRDTLGLSHWTGNCLISGTAPGSCAVTTGGYNIQRATFDGVANVTEIDYHRVWKFVG